MTAFLTEVGTKLADRWLDLLVLPGLLWLAVAGAAVRLGQDAPFDFAAAQTGLDRLAENPAAHSFGTVLLVAVGVLLASSAAGLAASATGGLLQRLWALPGRSRPLSWLRSSRQHRWDAYTAELKTALARAADPALHGAAAARATDQVRALGARRSRLAAARPDRPTWTGDRLHAAAARIDSTYGLDLALAWPRLWSVLPEQLRTDLGAAQTACTAAARLVGWGLLYAALSAVWWPASLIGTTVLITGWLRARATTAVLADLIGTAADLYTADLAEKLGLPVTRPLTVQTGLAITRILRGTPPMPSAS